MLDDSRAFTNEGCATMVPHYPHLEAETIGHVQRRSFSFALIPLSVQSLKMLIPFFLLPPLRDGSTSCNAPTARDLRFGCSATAVNSRTKGIRTNYA